MHTDERPDATPDGTLTWNVLRQSDEVVIQVSGELDMATAPELSNLLERLDEVGECVVLDLAGLEFCDSSGLRSLLVLHRRADDRGVRLVLRSPTQPVRRLFELTNTGALLERN